MRFLFLLSVSLFSVFQLYAQVKKDAVYSDKVKTVEFYRTGWVLSYPHMTLHSTDRLTFSFDVLGGEQQQYSYRILHCNADWTPSLLFANEYIEGFEVNQITDYDNGFNTTVDYVNYQLQIPNEDFGLKVSGNYLLQVFDEISDAVLIEKRFWVSEELVDMSLKARRPVEIEYVDEYQQLELKVVHNRLAVDDAFSDIFVQIRQNNRDDNALSGLKPVFVHENELVFTFSEKTAMRSGNEFRNLNMYNLQYQSEDIDSMWFDGKYNRIRLFLDEYRSNKPYFENDDFNGRFYITDQNARQNKREGDYAKVQFSLHCQLPFSYGKVYLFGAFSNWELSDAYEMEYDYEQNMYVAELLLKQGYYDYAYVFVEGEKNKASFAEIEGDFFQTENDYVVLIYYHDRRLNCDRLVGCSVVNYKY